MGYRSTFVTDDQAIILPQWFIDKWQDAVNIEAGNRLPISSRYEAKYHDEHSELVQDLQKILREYTMAREIFIVFMGEDGGLLQFRIFHDRVETIHNTIY